jgi:hypothetical protein
MPAGLQLDDLNRQPASALRPNFRIGKHQPAALISLDIAKRGAWIKQPCCIPNGGMSYFLLETK